MLRNLLHRLLPAGTIAGLVLAPALIAPQTSPVQAQGTPGLIEFRWDTDRDYRKLYYYLTSTLPDERSTWYLTLRAKDRKTAILKLTVTARLLRLQTEAGTHGRLPHEQGRNDASHQMP